MIQPYLNFYGNTGDAILFYERVFGGTNKVIMQFKDAPPNPAFQMPEEMMELIMHAEMDIEGTRFHFSDSREETVDGNIISLAVMLDNPERVMEIFQGLKEGSAIEVEAAPTFFSPMYACLRDKFGVKWQLICSQ